MEQIMTSRLFLYPSLFSPLRRIPGPPLGHLLYGQFPAIINGEAGIPQREWVKQYGPVIRAVGPLGLERLIFMKPDALHKILVSDWVDYPRPGFMRSTLGLTAGWGLLTVTGNEHKQMRKSMNPAFSIPNLMAREVPVIYPHFLSEFNLAEMDMYYEPTETLIQLLGSKIDAAENPAEGSTQLMYEWMSKVTLDIICKTAFGYETNSLRQDDKGAYAMSDKAMMEQVLTFLGAGHETTASGLAWTLWLLANDKESQTRLRDEITPLLADSPRPDYRVLKDLQWLDCVIMESLRVLPPVPMTFRSANKTDYIDGILVPKGTILYIPIRVINTWKELWGEDAESFRPSRWLNLPKAYQSSSSTLSFLSGPHACIGKTLAIIEMKVVLA
ncbi:hypothetical protein C0991_007739 [Blastosporella zonata]|nr:hypothetical protein C0991_007739 [Blastosporella zonata]